MRDDDDSVIINFTIKPLKKYRKKIKTNKQDFYCPGVITSTHHLIDV